MAQKVDVAAFMKIIEEANGKLADAMKNVQALGDIDISKAFSKDEHKKQYLKVQAEYESILMETANYCHSNRPRFCALAALHKDCIKEPTQEMRMQKFITGFRALFTAEAINEGYKQVHELMKRCMGLLRESQELTAHVTTVGHQVKEWCTLIFYLTCLSAVISLGIVLIVVPGGGVVDVAGGVIVGASMGTGALAAVTGAATRAMNLYRLSVVRKSVKTNISDMETHCNQLQKALLEHQKQLGHFQYVDVAVDLDKIPDLVKSFDDLFDVLVQPMKVKK